MTSLFRLNNLYAKSPSLSKVAGTIDASHHDYFVRHVLAGEHGSVQAILSHFWSKFYDYCTTVAKIPPVWNIDNKNPERLAEILSRLNFQDLTDFRFAYETQATELAKLKYELSSLRSNSSRRSNPRAPKPTKQPVPSNGKPVRARSSRPKVPHPSGPTQGPKGTCNGQGHGEAKEEA